MSLQRGKRRRRMRRVHDDEYVRPEPEVAQQAETKPAKTRSRTARKVLAERSPIFPILLTLLCVGGAIFTGYGYVNSRAITTLLLSLFYTVLAIIEAYIAYRIIKARREATE